MENALGRLTYNQIIEKYSYAGDYFASISIEIIEKDRPLSQYLQSLPYVILETSGLTADGILHGLTDFISGMERLQHTDTISVKNITILGGHDKKGNSEYPKLVINTGEVLSVVGSTGSGKSRLLADIECMAQGDTPTGRCILLDGQVPSIKQRSGIGQRLVSQLSQNMNFVIDLPVGEFISLHAESRMVRDINGMVNAVTECANSLSGEPFYLDTPVTALSGGQSRALMIADTALLGSSPVVLIDEIENAGVDRSKALELLIHNEKIVLIATHDPVLALMGKRRIVIKNGGIMDVINTTPLEQENLVHLRRLDASLSLLRERLRQGASIDFELTELFGDSGVKI